jgi:hypothetical protein
MALRLPFLGLCLALTTLIASACTGDDPIIAESPSGDGGTDGGPGTDSAGGQDGASESGAGGTARLVAPLSTSRVTTRRPKLRWSMPAGASVLAVDLCRDRAMTASCVQGAVDTAGTSAIPPELQPGMFFWRVRTAGGSSPVWQLVVPATSAPRDTAWGSTLDLDGDGRSELAVASFSEDSAANARVFVYRGATGGYGANSVTKLGPTTAADYYETAVASAGDVNGDGYADLIVGARLAASGVGRAQIYFGGPTALGATPPPASMQPSITLTPPGASEAGGEFGYSVLGIGDVDGDGYGDVAIGAPHIASGGPQRGRVHVFYGGPLGPSTMGRHATLDGTLDNANFGNALSAGDLNGDGLADLVVAAFAPNGGGRAFVFVGGASGIATSQSPSVTIIGGDTSGQFGAAFTAEADINHDGLADVAVGARFDGAGNAGALLIYHGDATKTVAHGTAGATADESDAQRVNGASANAKLGWSVASAGDVDQDGYDDLVVGSPGEGGEAPTAFGRARLYFGGAGSIVARTPVVLAPPAGTIGFGTSATGLGTVTGPDLFQAIAIGAPTERGDMNEPYAGAVYVYLGSASGPTSTGRATWQDVKDPEGATTLTNGFGINVR